ncbi:MULTISPECIES: TonB-dependent receptor plug domain-containing protein [unclassified Saccharicrinis]|uniref:TonB-dependent receptor plug domain-containing protein n=1 Tax=unclassified Saccharicrinis TaxID=2646859 RepID=UPI003D34D99E
MKKVLICFIFILYTSQLLVARERMLQGKVTTFDSIPLIGASILVKSTKQIVKTDSSGFFSVSIQQKDKIKVTAHGFSNQHAKITDTIKFIDVNLKLKPGHENREMAVSCGHVKDKDKLYAVSSLNTNELDFTQYTSIYELIKGRFPGVEINGSDIIIRGTSSFLGSHAALLVVDGVIVDQVFFSNLIPSEIATINILKDAGAAEYGSRGANGVVLVQTIMKK